MALFKKAAVTLRSVRAQTSLRVVEGRLPLTNQSAIALDHASTYLDHGSSVKGILNFDGPARIDGEIEGEINSKDIVAIGEDAVVSADIKAVTIVVAGAVSGELSASHSIEIYSSAKVLFGSLTAPEMSIGEGATIEGTHITQPAAAAEDRKLQTSRKEDRLVPDPKRKEQERQPNSF